LHSRWVDTGAPQTPKRVLQVKHQSLVPGVIHVTLLAGILWSCTCMWWGLISAAESRGEKKLSGSFQVREETE
jgi:hypothetical protein